MMHAEYPIVSADEFIYTVRQLLGDHHQHPLSLPETCGYAYSHKSAASSWCHFLNGNSCSDYILLFSLMTLEELTHNGIYGIVHWDNNLTIF